jgi:hypothetical protein
MSVPASPDPAARSEGDTDIMRRGVSATGRWRNAELKAVMGFLLTSPLEVGLGGLEPGGEARLRRLGKAAGPLIGNLGELLQHPQPPLELLRMTKDYAKAGAKHAGSPLPSEVAGVLYYAAIAAARLRWGRSITRLSQEALRGGLDWALQQPWLDGGIRELMREGRKEIEQRPSSH